MENTMSRIYYVIYIVIYMCVDIVIDIDIIIFEIWYPWGFWN